jgi:serine/threonine protein phosphatase PrpC
LIRVARHSEKTDTGRQRRANEDSLYARSPLFIVADGMGGAKAGEVASQTAIRAFDQGLPEGPPEETLPAMIRMANRVIHRQSFEDPDLAGMGTTMTAALVESDRERVVIGHVGDSRAYRIRDGIIQRLTRDHSLVEEMRRRGQITQAEAEEHPQRSIITRALGPEADVDVDVQAVPAEPGDLFLLCSDGLTSMLEDETVKEIIVGADSLEDAVTGLVYEANLAGGRDNITVLLFQVEDPEAPLPSKGPPAGRQRRAGRKAGEPKRRSTGRRVALTGFIAVLLISLVGVGGWFASRQVWFVSTDTSGRVALYRGVPYELPFGLSAYELRYSTPIRTGELPPDRREVVADQKLRSREDATDLIVDLEESEGIKGRP